MATFDPENFRINSGSEPSPQKIRRFRKGEKFLAGPIPLDWLSKASALPGKALNVALALWFLKGVKKSETVHLTRASLRDFGVKRQAGYRGLKLLEKVGLVICSRSPGRRPIVTILSIDSDNNRNRKDCDMSGDPA